MQTANINENLNGKLLSDKTRMMMKQHDLGIFQVDNSAY
jgi:hypothetical protein